LRKILVTGAAGFIGSSLVERLQNLPGLEIVAIDSFTDYYPAAIKANNVALFGSAVRLVREDLNSADLGALLKGVDTVFHQAGQPGVRPSWGRSFDAYLRDNVQASQRLLEACRSAPDLRRVVFASSSSIYGDAERYPTLESDRPQPLSPYGVTKLAAEHLMVLYAKQFGVPAVALRYFTVYGPRQRPDMGFTRFITRSLLGMPFEVYGDGTQIRDFTFVSDIVEANIAAATAPELEPGVVLNVSGGASVSLRDALATIAELTNGVGDLRFIDSAPGDVFRTGGDSTLALQTIGWSPKVGIRDGLQQQVDWLRQLLQTYAPLVGGA
jgi:UDP-glucuronate 4-epimerase